MSQDFALWAGCQRIFNVTPVLVEDLREHQGEVRFLATVRDWDGSDIDDMYDDDDILAIGLEDEDGDDRLVAVIDRFQGEPCIVVARTAASYLEDDTRALEVRVFLAVSAETRNQAIELVKTASLEESFENRWQEREEAAARDAEVVRQQAIRRAEPTASGSTPQGQSLWQRWFGKKA